MSAIAVARTARKLEDIRRLGSLKVGLIPLFISFINRF